MKIIIKIIVLFTTVSIVTTVTTSQGMMQYKRAGGMTYKRNGGVPDECRGKYDTSIYTQVRLLLADFLLGLEV